MLPTARYFQSFPCPFYQSSLCTRPFCHYKHEKVDNRIPAPLAAEPASGRGPPEDEAAQHTFTYNPTPLSQLGQSEVPSYSPTPISKAKRKVAPDEAEETQPKKSKQQANEHDVVSSILADSSKEAVFESHKGKDGVTSKKKPKKQDAHKKKKEKKDADRDRDRDRRDGKDDKKASKRDSKAGESSHSSRHKSHKSHKSRDKEKSSSSSRRHKHKSSARNRSRSKERKESKIEENPVDNGDMSDSMLSFLDAMNQIDKKLGKGGESDVDCRRQSCSSDSEKAKKSSGDGEAAPSFLAAISETDKVVQRNADHRKPGRKRISAVKSNADGASCNQIARKKSSNPVQQMLSRLTKARAESQALDLESQLEQLTGDSPSTSGAGAAKEFQLPEGLRKGKVQRKAHAVTNTAVLRRPIIDSDSAGRVPANVRQKYLDSIVDECLKICPNNVAAAYKRAEDEERACSERSKTRGVYLHLVVGCIKRLRSEAPASAGRPPPPNNVVPNMVTTHMQILAGKPGTRGTWSIEDNARRSAPRHLSAEENYLMFKRYALTPEQLEENNFPTKESLAKIAAEIRAEDEYAKTCDRCKKAFDVDDEGFQVKDEECIYHWGRQHRVRGSRVTGFLNLYSCCKGEANSDGCQVNWCHVTNRIDPSGFVKTIDSGDASKRKIFALDCEMCYTTRGTELTRVTVIDAAGDTAYESFVRPDSKILDYNTRFSGVKEEHLVNVTTTIRDVQAVLLSMFSADTILCGHSLESDLRALKLIHMSVVDTSVVFPHKLGPPYKRALRTLCGEFLQRIIQEDVGGHDSKEDAMAALDLMKMKIAQDLKRMT